MMELLDMTAAEIDSFTELGLAVKLAPRDGDGSSVRTWEDPADTFAPGSCKGALDSVLRGNAIARFPKPHAWCPRNFVGGDTSLPVMETSVSPDSGPAGG